MTTHGPVPSFPITPARCQPCPAGSTRACGCGSVAPSLPSSWRSFCALGVIGRGEGRFGSTKRAVAGERKFAAAGHSSVGFDAISRNKAARCALSQRPAAHYPLPVLGRHLGRSRHCCRLRPCFFGPRMTAADQSRHGAEPFRRRSGLPSIRSSGRTSRSK